GSTMVHGGTKRHPEELRTLAIRRFRSCQNVAQLAREIGIPRQTLYRWTDESERVEARENGRLVSVENARESRLRKRIALLKDALASSSTSNATTKTRPRTCCTCTIRSRCSPKIWTNCRSYFAVLLR